MMSLLRAHASHSMCASKQKVGQDSPSPGKLCILVSTVGVESRSLCDKRNGWTRKTKANRKWLLWRPRSATWGVGNKRNWTLCVHSAASKGDDIAQGSKGAHSLSGSLCKVSRHRAFSSPHPIFYGHISLPWIIHIIYIYGVLRLFLLF